MIMAIPAELKAGETVTLNYVDFRDQKMMHENVPVYIVAEATLEEWVKYKVDEEAQDEATVRQNIQKWMQLPLLRFYKVSVD